MGASKIRLLFATLLQHYQDAELYFDETLPISITCFWVQIYIFFKSWHVVYQMKTATWDQKRILFSEKARIACQIAGNV